MQRLFEVAEDKQQEADRVLEIYLKKRVSDVMYQARVDSVKVYYAKRDQILDDTLARPIELEYEQYLDGRLCGAMMRCGLNSAVIGAQKNSK